MVYLNHVMDLFWCVNESTSQNVFETNKKFMLLKKSHLKMHFSTPAYECVKAHYLYKSFNKVLTLLQGYKIQLPWGLFFVQHVTSEGNALTVQK